MVSERTNPSNENQSSRSVSVSHSTPAQIPFQMSIITQLSSLRAILPASSNPLEVEQDQQEIVETAGTEAHNISVAESAHEITDADFELGESSGFTQSKGVDSDDSSDLELVSVTASKSQPAPAKIIQRRIAQKEEDEGKDRKEYGKGQSKPRKGTK